MSKFTDRLWREIVREHGADLRELERQSAGRSRRTGRVGPRGLLAGTGLVGVAGAGAALAIVLSAAGSSPAFAVTHNSDGSYSVGISELRAIPFANARLRALGLRARLVQMAADCTSAPPSSIPQSVVVPEAAKAAAMAAGARINPAQIPAGRMLMVPAIKEGETIRLAKAMAVTGSVPACLPAPARVCFSGPAAGGGTKTSTGSSTTGTSTDTTTTGTGTTSTATTTTGQTTSTTGATGPTPSAGAVRCFVPPPPALCAAIKAKGGPGAGGTGASTTGTTSTGTTTTGTGTTTTGTSPGPVTAPVPRQIIMPAGACLPPPRACVAAQATKLTPAQIALFKAKVAAIRARIAQLRASAPSTTTTGTGTSTTGTGTSTTGTGRPTTGTSAGPGPAPPPFVHPAQRLFFGPVACQVHAATGATGATGVTAPIGPATDRAHAARSSRHAAKDSSRHAANDRSSPHVKRHTAHRDGTHARAH